MTTMHDLHPSCGAEETWDWDWWVMRCGLVVLAHENGTLDPPIDFVGPSDGTDDRITCKACKRQRPVVRQSNRSSTTSSASS